MSDSHVIDWKNESVKEHQVVGIPSSIVLIVGDKIKGVTKYCIGQIWPIQYFVEFLCKNEASAHRHKVKDIPTEIAWSWVEVSLSNLPQI